MTSQIRPTVSLSSLLSPNTVCVWTHHFLHSTFSRSARLEVPYPFVPFSLSISWMFPLQIRRLKLESPHICTTYLNMIRAILTLLATPIVATVGLVSQAFGDISLESEVPSCQAVGKVCKMCGEHLEDVGDVVQHCVECIVNSLGRI